MSPDGHNDLALLVRYLYNNHIYSEGFRQLFESDGLPGQVDLPRLREGQNGGLFWSVYWPCPADGEDFSDENYLPSLSYTSSSHLGATC